MHCIETRHSRRWMSLQSWSICHLKDLKINHSALVLIGYLATCSSTLCWRHFVPLAKAMCSFLVANQIITNLTFVNFFLQPRGPDLTTHTRLHGFDFVHNLLHMTGDRRPQPFLSSDGQIVALFNGEIYNWRQLSLEAEGKGFPPFTSDGEAILPMYYSAGEAFPLALQGEFAIAVFDFQNRRAVFAADTFGTKPLWYALLQQERRVGVSSYKSGLVRLGFGDHEIHMVGPNRVLTICLDTFRLIKQTAVFEFDMRQFKNSTEDYIKAFNTAVKLRTRDLEETGRPLFVGLSSGFDSGAIHASLHHNSVSHHAFALFAEEIPQLLHDRAMYAKSTSEVSIVFMNVKDFELERSWLAERAEPFAYLGYNFTGQVNVLDDYAAAWPILRERVDVGQNLVWSWFGMHRCPKWAFIQRFKRRCLCVLDQLPVDIFQHLSTM